MRFKALREACKGNRGHGTPAVKFLPILKKAAVPRYSEGLQVQGEASSKSCSSNSSCGGGGNSGDSGSSGSNSSCGGGGSSGDSASGSSSSSGSSSRRKGGVLAYLKPWQGGFNLVACLREMLMGQPCYRPPSHAASATHAATVNTSAAASNTLAAAVNTPAAAANTPAATNTRAGADTPAAADTFADTVNAPAAAVRTPAAATNAGSASIAAVASTAANTPAAATPDVEGRVCGAAGCGKVEGDGVKRKICSACRKVTYCSRDCQKAHWPSHKLSCPGRTSKRGGTNDDRDGGKESGEDSGKGSCKGSCKGNGKGKEKVEE
ncbi:hypothetical protein CLOM_g8451 [Closterium sp. NIES-68]|nr:hypothetical protein CLOM_g8451 [Closterium sp. NIES-68]GJP67483.1 hypothetical protein CLOP_g24302 [Closterium sp. NIES-67]